MWSSGIHLGALIEPGVNGIQPGWEIAAHIEPPVADEDRLWELCAIWAEERGLSSIDVAVMPACRAYSTDYYIYIYFLIWKYLCLSITHPDTLSPCRQRIQDTPARRSKSWCTAPPTVWDSQRQDDLQMILLLQLVCRRRVTETKTNCMSRSPWGFQSISLHPTLLERKLQKKATPTSQKCQLQARCPGVTKKLKLFPHQPKKKNGNKNKTGHKQILDRFQSPLWR